MSLFIDDNCEVYNNDSNLHLKYKELNKEKKNIENKLLNTKMYETSSEQESSSEYDYHLEKEENNDNNNNTVSNNCNKVSNYNVNNDGNDSNDSNDGNSNGNGNSTCSLRESFDTSLTQSAISYKEVTRADIEKIIKMKPIDIVKYKKAFVHKSIVKTAKQNNELPEYMQESYERYEFLGDSVLSLIVAKYIFHRFPNSHEGCLTKLRTKLVNGKTLSLFATKLGLSKFLILDYKVENINGRNNNRILEDIFESLICAIYLDLGFNYAEKFIIDLIEKYIDFDEILIDDNYKDILLRFCQNKFGITPCFKVIETTGPPHNRSFKVSCFIQDIEYKYGKGKNKKDAEQLAAKETLRYFKIIK